MHKQQTDSGVGEGLVYPSAAAKGREMQERSNRVYPTERERRDLAKKAMKEKRRTKTDVHQKAEANSNEGECKGHQTDEKFPS